MSYWMNLPKEYRKGKFVILPIEYEKDVTYGRGASLGSKEIIKASEQLEYYDCEIEKEAFLQGIELLEPIKSNEPEEIINKVSNTVKENKNKFIIGIGGDHAVTIGLTTELDEDVSVIILDAHADFFHSWNGSEQNHRCVSQRLINKHNLALIGIRAMDKDENELIKNNENVHLVKSNNYDLEKVKQILPKLKQKVYISVDVDVFDPSFIRNTGTPEPGGLSWNQIMELLQLIFQEKEVIGADVVEFAPQENYRAEAYALAKLVYRLIGLKAK
jgi:agmatinase